MHQTLNDPIEVLALFRHGKIIPKRFRWRNITYAIDHIPFSYTKKQGEAVLYLFSASVNERLFELQFHSKDHIWRLTQVYVEG